jgi:hypothetical protein
MERAGPDPGGPGRGASTRSGRGAAVGADQDLLGKVDLLDGQHIGTTLAQPGVLRAVLLSAAIVTVFGLLAYGAGAVIRHTAGAITAVLGVIFLLPALAQALPGSWYQDIVRWLPGAGALSPTPGPRPRGRAICSPPGASSPCSPATRCSCSPRGHGRSSAAMPEMTAPGRPDYPGRVERLYGWLRRHPWLVDGTLARQDGGFEVSVRLPLPATALAAGPPPPAGRPTSRDAA